MDTALAAMHQANRAAEDKAREAQAINDRIDSILGPLRQLWLANPKRRLCDLLESVCCGPFAGVDDENLAEWLAAHQRRLMDAESKPDIAAERLHKLKMRMLELNAQMVCADHMVGLSPEFLPGQIAAAVTVLNGQALCADCLLAKIEPIMAAQRGG